MALPSRLEKVAGGASIHRLVVIVVVRPRPPSPAAPPAGAASVGKEHGPRPEASPAAAAGAAAPAAAAARRVEFRSLQRSELLCALERVVSEAVGVRLARREAHLQRGRGLRSGRGERGRSTLAQGETRAGEASPHGE